MQRWDIQSLKDGYKKVMAEKKDPQPLYPNRSLNPRQNFLDPTALIRSLQRAEGENDCFRTASVLNCNRIDCPWREFCFEK